MCFQAWTSVTVDSHVVLVLVGRGLVHLQFGLILGLFPTGFIYVLDVALDAFAFVCK